MFDEYRSKRAALCKEGEEEQRYSRVYVVPYHIIQMMNMLKDQVLHHSFTKATATLETVAMAMDQVPDILRVIGVERLTSDPRSYKEAVKLFKYMFTWQPQHRQTLILDTALFIASYGNLREAYDTLQSQIHAEPFKSNRLLHGYSGMLKSWMWREGLGESPGGVVKEKRVVRRTEKYKVLAKQAMRHFTDMECLDMTPSTSSNLDSFIWMHAQLLVWLREPEDALQLLISYRDKFPGRLTSSKMVCEHVRQLHDDTDITVHLRAVVEIDESSEEALELAQKLTHEAATRHEAARLLRNYLDYPCHEGNQLAWDTLQLLEKPTVSSLTQ